ncbi:hypothetical protein [Luteococcus sp. OSA5]|uniref:hypothetical protein n=1 Tax=Luteococcus sp. OSA5 TaxID=3401630 RepID=UPI003B42FFF7
MHPRASEYYELLRREGRLEIPGIRSQWIACFVMAGLVVVFGIALTVVLVVSAETSSTPVLPVTLFFWGPILFAVLALVIPGWILARRRMSLVITGEAVEEHGNRAGRREVLTRYRWVDVEQVRLVRARHTLVGLQLTPQRYEQFVSDCPRVPRSLLRGTDRLLGPRTALLSRYRGGPRAIRDLLSTAHSEVLHAQRPPLY